MRRIKDYLIILRIKRGDVDAWEQLVEKYYDQIYQYCKRRFFGNHVLAEDLTQDTFMKVISKIDSYQFSGSFFNYLYTVAVNTCNNFSKRHKLDESSFDEAYDLLLDDQTNEPVILDEKAQMIQQALDHLPEYQREAVILKYYHELKVKEIAKITNASVATTQSRIYQGLVKMKQELEKEDISFE
ncbi:RNA polymerase sigma factor [Enterococcus devriesei]|uniref:RNA polymerase sigma factor n=1 Tax=Enterococcus devriesei TaxID=319970 RepID=UPI0036D3F4AE